ncbi:hypothetical protein NOM68_18545, partial [Proteus mirabilis]|uniref:hypothetical protein n=1 Tax=Proteus mirabilis TaxID=584 RepID=UPI00217EF371
KKIAGTLSLRYQLPVRYGLLNFLGFNKPARFFLSVDNSAHKLTYSEHKLKKMLFSVHANAPLSNPTGY